MNMNIGSPAKKVPFNAIQLKDSVRAMWSNYFPSTGRPKKKFQERVKQQYLPEGQQKFFTYEQFPRNPNYTEKFPPAIKMKTENEESNPKNPQNDQEPPSGNDTRKVMDSNAYYDCRVQPPYPPQYPQQYDPPPNNQRYPPSSYQQPNFYSGYQYPYGNVEYPPYQVPPQYMPQGNQYMTYQQQQALWPVQLEAERQMYQAAPANPYPLPEGPYLPQEYQPPVQQVQWPLQTEDERRMYQPAPANPYSPPENQYLPPAQAYQPPVQQAQWPWPSEEERRAYENTLLGNGAILSRSMGGQNMGFPNIGGHNMGFPNMGGQNMGFPNIGGQSMEGPNMGYDVREHSYEPDVIYPNVLSPMEMNPLSDYRRNSTVLIPSPQDYSYQYYGLHHPLAKRDDSTRRSLQYPKCFAVSDKQKRFDDKVKLPYWPLLGTIGKLGPRKARRQDAGGILDKSSLVCLADTTRNLEMSIVRKLSELKAKEHMAKDERQNMMHRTEQAKEDFQEKIGDQMSLLSEARKADISAKEALTKVTRLERELANENKVLHRLKEEEDALYEELLQSEAKVAMADMQIIPRLPTADDLAEFLTG